MLVDGIGEGWPGGVSPMGGRIGSCGCIFATLLGGAVGESLLFGGRNIEFFAVKI